MLFDRLVVYHDRAPGSAALNMAIDEALLEESTKPALRFYGWRRPALSFGYFGKFSEIAPSAGDREIVRRWTGGGSVWHGNDLTYSLITPATESAAALGPATIYAALHGAICAVLRAEGKEAQLAAGVPPKISDECFANPVPNDVLFHGRKIAGAAQRRTRGGFLHQGSIQFPGLTESFCDQFARRLAERVDGAEIRAETRSRAAVLAMEKYGADDWLRRC